MKSRSRSRTYSACVRLLRRVSTIDLISARQPCNTSRTVGANVAAELLARDARTDEMLSTFWLERLSPNSSANAATFIQISPCLALLYPFHATVHGWRRARFRAALLR